MLEEIKKKYDDRDNMAETAQTPSECLKPFGSHPVPTYCIAIPTYKRTDLLRFALDSALRQEGFSDYEILVVDNNPERGDETEKLMAEYKDNGRVAYYKNSANLGMTGNWNKLYLLARTEWVVMLHDDDMLYPDFMCNMAHIVSNDPEAACIYSCYNHVRNESNNQPERTAQPIKVMTLKETDYLTGCHLHAPLGMTLRRRVAEEVGGFNPDFYPSLDFHFHAKLAHYHTVRWLRGYPLATYRWLVNASGKEETLVGWVEKDNHIKRLILKNNSAFYPRWIFEIYLKWFDYLYRLNWYKDFKPSTPIEVPSKLCLPFYYITKLRLGLPKKLRKCTIYNQPFFNKSEIENV